MGKVYKRRKKWYIDYRDASGRRIRKVAGTTKHQSVRILNELECCLDPIILFDSRDSTEDIELSTE